MKHKIDEDIEDIDKQNARINKVIEGIDEDDIMALLEAWKKYLKSVLVFPFEARVIENPDIGEVFYKNERVIVKKISAIDDLYGIIVEVWKLGVKKGKIYDLPLCILEVTDKNSPNYQPVDDYSIWFVNR